MRVPSWRWPGPSPLLVAVLVAACAGRTPEIAELRGECGTVYGAEICTWGEQAGGQVVGFGATIPVALVDNAPEDIHMQWPPVADAVLALPAEVQAATGFSHLTIFWEAHGHPPGPYLTPHFDFHFYRIAPAAMEAIDCTDPSKPAELPAGYVLPDVSEPGLGDLIGICVPKMGMHSLPASEMEGEAVFAKTMVVGYWKAEPIFIEPMIAAATLRARQSFTVRPPAIPGATGYPTGFEATWDEASQSYRFAFSGSGGAGGS